MGLTASEVVRLKYELGYNTLAVGAEPYFSFVSVFDQVIRPYLIAGASTTSDTEIDAVDAGDPPAPASLILASVSGISAGDRIVVDVDSRQESATIQAVLGTTVTVLLSLAHTGTYPVEVEGGCSIVRAILRKLQAISGLGASADSDALSDALESAGIQAVDEIKFFEGATSSRSRIGQVKAMREYWRDELASALGVVRLNGGGGSGSISMY